MATDQSALQGFVQNMAGTQTTAQSAVPSATNNGNPNTVYNWSTYLPQFTGGAQPTASFDLLAAQAPASSPGYTPPFAADPYAAAVVSGVPQAQPNANVNRILGNLFGGANPWGQTPSTGAPPVTGTPPVTTPPVTGPTTPRAPNTGGLPSRPVGPISGLVDNWVRSPNTGSPPDTTAPTNLFDNHQGREYAMDWLRQNNGANFESVGDWLESVGGWDSPQAQATNEEGTGWWDNVTGFFGDLIGQAQDAIVGDGSWQQVLDVATELLGISGDWYNSETGEWNNPLEAMGIMGVLETITGQYDPNEPVTQEQLDELAANLNNMQAEQIQQQTERSTALIDRMLNGDTDGLSDEEIAEYFPDADQEWSQSQWREMQDSMAWNNFWGGNDQAAPSNPNGVRQPTLGLPALDNVDAFLNNMNRRNLEISNWFQNMRGRAQQ